MTAAKKSTVPAESASESAAANSRLVLPIILDFTVENYPLYPGHDGSGIRFTVDPGVSIIAGINGLGKTTLLNVLFRLLSGPVEWKKRRIGEMAGSSPIELGAWRDTGYFKNRVPNAAKGATASATVGFGDRRVQVTRSLDTLAVRSLIVDGVPQKADQGSYQGAVCDLSGLSRFADFFLVLRYLVFFLEERQPLVWDADAQTDVLRILFFDDKSAGLARERFDQIQRLDSDYRNQRFHLNKIRDRLARSQAENTGSAETLSMIASTQTKLRALEDEEEELGSRIDQADLARRTQRLKLEQAKIYLAEVQQEYAHAEQHHFASLFPRATEIANQILVQVGTGGGCLVCGNRGPTASRRVRACAKNGHCPVCDSDVSEQEGIVPIGTTAGKRLVALEREVKGAGDAVTGLEQSLDDAVHEFDLLATRANAIREDREVEEDRLSTLQASLPLGDEELSELNQTVNTLEGDLKRLRTELTGLEVEYAKLLRIGEARVSNVAEEVAARFTDFAGYFLVL